MYVCANSRHMFTCSGRIIGGYNRKLEVMLFVSDNKGLYWTLGCARKKLHSSPDTLLRTSLAMGTQWICNAGQSAGRRSFPG